MNQRLSTVFIAFFLLYTLAMYSEENFIMLEGKTEETLIKIGENLNKRISPCATFKIPLSLIGFETQILRKAKGSIWKYQDHYENFLEPKKISQISTSWVQCSSLSFSKILLAILREKNFHYYLAIFDYGNQDISKGFTNSWPSCSLKISPIEHVQFLKNFVSGKLSISYEAIQKTKNLLYMETLENGQKLFGKTAGSFYKVEGKKVQLGWFVGWIEDENLQTFYPFAYNIQDMNINFSEIILRVKQLAEERNTSKKSPL